MIDFDTLVLAPCMATFGQPVTFTPAGGAPVAIATAVFDAAYLDEKFEGEAAVAELRPVLGMRVSDLGGLPLPVYGDAFTIAGQAYRVLNVEPDGHGHLLIRLNRYQ